MDKPALFRQYLDNKIFKVLDEPVTFASGILSPVYCDNRKILGLPELRQSVFQALLNLLKKQQDEPKDKMAAIIGVATGGIAMAALLAQAVGLPMGYVRRQAKTHGTQSLVEGVSVQGKRVVLFEDCLTTGGSALEVLAILKAEGATVSQVVSVFDYGFLAPEKRKKFCPRWDALIGFSGLVAFMGKENLLSKKDLARLTTWHENTLKSGHHEGNPKRDRGHLA